MSRYTKQELKGEKFFLASTLRPEQNCDEEAENGDFTSDAEDLMRLQESTAI